MNKIRRHWPKLMKWVRFLGKGLKCLPQYIRYWGISSSAKRILKSLILPGANQVVEELGGFMQMQKSQIKGRRTPDYIVMAPDFTGNSAGIRCLYKLCWDLSGRGLKWLLPAVSAETKIILFLCSRAMRRPKPLVLELG